MGHIEHCPEELKRGLSTSSADANGPVVHHERLSALASNVNGYLLQLHKAEVAHSKTSL